MVWIVIPDLRSFRDDDSLPFDDEIGDKLLNFPIQDNIEEAGRSRKCHRSGKFGLID